MSMGIVNETDFEKELERLNQHKVKQEIKYVEIKKNGYGNGGRAPDDVNTPDSLRKIIGETSEINGRKEGLELAKKFGIKGSSVSAYANGSTSTTSYNKPKSDILDHINKSKERISKKARNRLILSLNHITEDKLSEAKVDVLANVARSMAAVVREMTPEVELKNNENNGVQFIFYSPKIKSEDSFDVIDLTNE